MSNSTLTIEQASERWINEGKKFKEELNSWLDVIYLSESEQTEPEPLETRKDLAPFVRDQIIELNEKGEHQKLRQMFPPDIDPFADELQKEFTKIVMNVILLPDNRVLSLSGSYYEKQVHLINNEEITFVPDIIQFGSSTNKAYIAKAYEDKIVVSKGWEGDTVSTFNYPKNYGQNFTDFLSKKKIENDFDEDLSEFTGSDFSIQSIHVFSDGKRILLTTELGIFILTEAEATLMHPEFEDWEEDDFESFEGVFSLSYPNADLSPDDKYISLGSQDSNHIIFIEEEGSWVKTGEIEPRSSYPHCTKFNYNIKADDGSDYSHLALSSCHFSSSATIGVGLDKLEKGFNASGYDADETLDFIDERNWIYSILPSVFGYLLGANNGYIWLKWYQGIYQIGYLHVGGTIMSMDFSEDRKTLIVGSYNGQIVRYKWTYDPDVEGNIDWNKNNRKDPFLITNLPFVDEKRYLFWKDHEPMIW